jgi:hypothetical protein
MPSNAIVVCHHAGSCPLPISVLAWRRCRAGSHHFPVSVHPCLLLSLPPPLVPCPSASSPAVVVALALIPCSSVSALAYCRRRRRRHRRQRSRPADCCHPPPLSPSLQPPSSSAATIIVATKPSLPPPSNLVLFGQSIFSRTEESCHQEVRSKRFINLFTAQLLGK